VKFELSPFWYFLPKIVLLVNSLGTCKCNLFWITLNCCLLDLFFCVCCYLLDKNNFNCLPLWGKFLYKWFIVRLKLFLKLEAADSYISLHNLNTKCIVNVSIVKCHTDSVMLKTHWQIAYKYYFVGVHWKRIPLGLTINHLYKNLPHKGRQLKLFLKHSQCI
jgi:hypothetical protein